MTQAIHPEWINELLDWQKRYSPEECMRLANTIAYENVLRNGGPFGAVIADQEGNLFSAGSNRVVASHDSTAHAEILAIRRLQDRLKTHELRRTGQPQFLLYSSASPCIMCFGAIWWAGFARVYSSASKEDAEAVGFSEGPVSRSLWEALAKEKGTEYMPNFCTSEHTLKPFKKFAEIGTLY